MDSNVAIRQPLAVDTRRSDYQELKSRIHQSLLDRLDLDRLAYVKREDAEPEIRTLIAVMLDREAESTPLSLYERESLVTDVLNELFGLGPLESLLRDQAISDILINRHDQVYIERNGVLELTGVVFKDDRHLLRIIERIVSAVGRRIDESSPMVDARLADGSRVNAIIPPIALDGPCVSIRRFRTERLGPQDLVERGTLTQPMLDFLKIAVAHASISSFLAAPAPARRRSSTSSRGSSPIKNASLPSKTPPSSCSDSATWSGWRRGRPTSKAAARSSSAIW